MWSPGNGLTRTDASTVIPSANTPVSSLVVPSPFAICPSRAKLT
jgi:hypothetical protein